MYCSLNTTKRKIKIWRNLEMVSKDYKLGGGTPNWMSGRAHNITFIVTEGCNLRCKYCYQVHKNGENRMDFETAKKKCRLYFR